MPLLQVTVVRGSDLPASDFSFDGGKSDPYVVVECGGAQRKTTVVKNDLNPVWQPAERFDFDVADPNSAILRVEVFDHDRFNKDDLLGSIVLPVSRFAGGAMGTTVIENFPLEVVPDYAGQQCNATLQLVISLLGEGEGEIILRIWENEVWTPLKDWHVSDSTREQWSSYDESRSSSRFDGVAPPAPEGLVSSGWSFNAQKGDANGWLYAKSFAGPWTSKKSMFSLVRRRMWENVCRKDEASDKQGSAMF